MQHHDQKLVLLGGGPWTTMLERARAWCGNSNGNFGVSQHQQQQLLPFRRDRVTSPRLEARFRTDVAMRPAPPLSRTALASRKRAAARWTTSAASVNPVRGEDACECECDIRERRAIDVRMWLGAAPVSYPLAFHARQGRAGQQGRTAGLACSAAPGRNAESWYGN